jgi:large subunit ribosomal protein L35
MPKKKTHKATAKRFRATGKGKLRRRKQGSSHLKRKKSKRVKREMRGDVKIDPANVKRIERLLGKRFRRG